jgi:xanthine dehydrogenase YagS FAD-binding subunit
VRNFAYARAQNVAEAVRSAADGAVVIAGGTELLNWMRLGITSADKVIDIGRLDALRGISAEGDNIRIGALSTLNEVGESDLVRRSAPVLAEACLKAASAQLRNLATLGGNVLQKTRCPYFRAEAGNASAMPWPCNRRVPGSGCAARDSGYTRLALFGGTDECLATHPSDPAVALAALDATVQVATSTGQREIAMTDFLVTPEEAARTGGGRGGRGRDEAAVLPDNRLKVGEIIVGYRFAVGSMTRRSAYVKVRERASYEYAMVSAAVTVEHEGGRIRSARIALGSVAGKPWRLPSAESALVGQPVEPAALDRALDAALAAARAPAGNEFKIVLARNAARAALLAASADAGVA